MNMVIVSQFLEDHVTNTVLFINILTWKDLVTKNGSRDAKNSAKNAIKDITSLQTMSVSNFLKIV